MKRPLFTIGVTFLIWLTVLTYINKLSFALISCVISYVLFLVGMYIKACRKSLLVPAVCLSVCFCSLMFSIPQKDYLSLSSSAGLKKQIVAVVKQEPKYYENYSRYYCTCEIVSLNDKKYNGNIRLSFSTKYEDIELSDFVIGNVISFDGQLYTVGGDIKSMTDYYKSLKTYIGANSIQNLTVIRQGTKPVTKLGADLRKKISSSLNKYFSSETAGVLTALITGNKQSLDDEIYNYFKLIGIAHLMAVSGMHLSILTMLIEFLIRKIKSKRLKGAIVSVFVFLIMFSADFSASVIRAGTMRLMRITADATKKQNDSLNSLGLSMIIVLTINPFACKSVAFLLSVLSTLSILVLSLPLSERLGTRLGDILNIRSTRLFSLFKAVVFSIATSFSIMLFTAPVLVHVFGSISLMTPLANLVFLPLSPVLIAGAAISALLCSIGLMPGFLADAVEGLTRLCIYLAKILSHFTISTPEVTDDRETLICFIVCVSIIAFGALGQYLIKKRRKSIK